MTDLFASPRSMLRWGKKHVDNLELQINAFMKDKPWSHLVEKDADGITELHKIKFTERLSEFLPNMLFDAANNFRAVLDQTGFAVASAAKIVPEPTAFKFPFGPTEAQMLDNAKGGCKHLPPEIQSLFKSFKPYKGGNNALWALNELANTPKHKIIVPIAIGGGTTSIMPHSWSGPSTIKPPIWDPGKNEIIFLSVGEGGQISYDANVTFSISLNDVDEVIRGQHPVAVLRVMASEVAEVLDLTETACKAIGLIR